MKRNRLVKVLTSAALTAVMVASMGISSFAAVDSVGLTKTVTTDGSTYAPNTTFAFTVSTGQTGTLSGEGFGEGSLVVYAGVEGGISLADGNDFSFGPEVEGMGTVASSYQKSGSVNIHTKASDGTTELYSKPGIYHYTISEVVPEDQNKYEGIIYDTEVRDIYVYVAYKANSTTEFEVTNVVVAKDGKKQGDVNGGIAFVNNYGATDPDDPSKGDTTHDLTVTKQVTGNQGDKNHPFEFTVKVDGQTGEWYKVIVTAQDKTTTEDHLVSGTSTKYFLKDSESIQILGLSKNDTYTVTETDYSSDGYTTTDGNKSGNVTVDGTNYMVINEKNVSSPTGIVLSFAPYILLVALAGVFGVSFLHKKREDF